MAIDKFGQEGFDAVGTREIAGAVGTAMSSITYHFGGKEGLYLAAAEHIFDHMQSVVRSEPDRLPGPEATADQRISMICTVLRQVGEFMLAKESAPFALFIGREQQAPSPGVLKLMNERMRPMMEALVSQVRLLRTDLDDRQARATTLYLFGMAICLRHSRASLRLLLGVDEIDPVTSDMLLGQLEANARLVLEGGRT
ncbi:MAG TPA: CerR family C-terminal domain-containing protein [Sphingomonadaceae bacterium]|nr:CerR family C-terminal domain-containing protein [Sphingomonadaceae bacterium]